jgi:(S)-sulfolactate dehydrogenase
MVLITEPCDPAHFGRLEPHPICYRPTLAENPRALRALVADAVALVVRNRTRVDQALLAAAPRLRVIGRLGVGLDNIDLDACRAAGIPVIVPRGANADAVADCTLMALLMAARRWDRILAGTRHGGWQRRVSGYDLLGRRLSLIGFGATGRAVARRAVGFGLVLTIYDPRVGPDDPEVAALKALRAESLGEALHDADFISLHLPLKPDTRHLINRETLAACRPGVWLINTSRGGLIDETALLEALASGRLGGAFLDVRETEPPPRDDPLRRHPRVLSTPHVAGLSRDADTRVTAYVLDAVARHLQ